MGAGLIEDSTHIWWDLRPSARYPTLETRVMDVCTRVDDTISLAAMLVCILRMLYRLRTRNQRWRIYTPMLIRENRWRAMRYSYDEMLELIAEDAEALGCAKEVAAVRDILERGTSAHRQLWDYEREQAAGKSVEDSLKSVVDTLIKDTAAGL